MTCTRRWILMLAVAVATAGAAAPLAAAEKIDLLLVDGQNHHDWKATSPVIKEMLEKTGRFKVDVATSPPAKSPAEAWEAFRPDFARYDVVLTNYQGDAWPKPVADALVQYVESGGGLVVYHFAVASFRPWDAYNRMIGLGWRPADFGEGLALDDDGTVVRRPKGEGPGAGHGPMHVFEVTVRDPDHPITKGLPAKWTHAKDELYHGQRGPARDMHILATAFSAKEHKGTGLHEPMAWTVPFGKGRVFVTLLGHHVEQTKHPGAAALLLRGAEWAATGKVTLPVPDDVK
jgi:type 1 glutamine amidotransferase